MVTIRFSINCDWSTCNWKVPLPCLTTGLWVSENVIFVKEATEHIMSVLIFPSSSSHITASLFLQSHHHSGPNIQTFVFLSWNLTCDLFLLSIPNRNVSLFAPWCLVFACNSKPRGLCDQTTILAYLPSNNKSSVLSRHLHFRIYCHLLTSTLQPPLTRWSHPQCINHLSSSNLPLFFSSESAEWIPGV